MPATHDEWPGQAHDDMDAAELLKGRGSGYAPFLASEVGIRAPEGPGAAPAGSVVCSA